MACNLLSEYDLRVLSSSAETVLCMVTFMLLSLPNRPTMATLESGLNLIRKATEDADEILQKYE